MIASLATFVAGQFSDNLSGLIYMNARYYDPTIGQFISPDTIVPNPSNLFDYNRYMYGYGNPVKYSDPSGHCAVDGNGNENWEGEENFACWTQVYRMLSYSDLQAFRDMFGDNYGVFHLSVVKNASFGADYFSGIADKLERTLYPQSHYTRVNWHQPPPAEPLDGILADLLADGPCGVWDCVALGLSATSLGLSIAQTAAVACTAVTGPVCGSAATALTIADAGVQFGSVTYSFSQYAQGKDSAFDLSVSLADVIPLKPTLHGAASAASVTPGVGIAVDAAMLGWELLDPFIPSENWGGVRGAR